MKKVIFLFGMLFLLLSCSQEPTKDTTLASSSELHFDGFLYDSKIKKLDLSKALSGIYTPLKTPYIIGKLGLFTQNDTGDIPPEWTNMYFENTSVYVKVGDITLSDGKKLDLIETGDVYFVAYQSKYYALPILSDIDGTLQGQVNPLHVVLDEENLFFNILKDTFLFPKKILFSQSGKKYSLTYKNSLSTFQTTGMKELIDFSKEIGYPTYIEDPDAQEKVKSDVLKSDGIFIKIHDTYLVYALDIPFEIPVYEEGSRYPWIHKIIFQKTNEKPKELLGYHYQETESCGISDGTYLYVPNFEYTILGDHVYQEKYRAKEVEKEYLPNFEMYKKYEKKIYFHPNDLEKIGTISGGYDVLGFSDTDNAFLKDLYEYEYMYTYCSFTSPCTDFSKVISYKEFTQNLPLFFWKDPFGRLVLFLSPSTSSQALCVAKPVIYLYPEKKEAISIVLNWEKKNLLSIPKYMDSWEVISDPESNIFDTRTQKYYPYLFWEDLGKYRSNWEDGFLVQQENLETFLDEKLSFMGLQGKEIQDFKEYWIPYMKEYPYYQIHFLQTPQIDTLFPLIISPKPDTQIRVLMHFTGKMHYQNIPVQKLIPQRRVGFTLIEWGGNKK